MTLVVDASAMVAAFTDDGPEGHWAIGVIRRGGLAAPDHVHVESAQTIRRSELAGRISAAEAALADAALLRAPIRLHAYSSLADRVWELRHSVSAYDAAYVALAEALDAPLVTLDRRLMRAHGPRCAFLTLG